MPSAMAMLPPSDSGFIRRSGMGLITNGKPYHFLGFDNYSATTDLTLVDNGCGTSHSGSQLQTDLNNIGPAQKVFRSWFFQPMTVHSGVRTWTVFDNVLATAKANNQRVIVTLGNGFGDCDDLAGFHTLTWFTTTYNTTVQAGMLTHYRAYVAEVVTRYKNDPTILCWELMNEAEFVTANVTAMTTWANDMAGLIKGIDTNHLVCPGFYLGSGNTSGDFTTSHGGANVDLCSYHDYNEGSTAMPTTISAQLGYAATINKPLFIGEVEIAITGAGAVTLVVRNNQLQAKLAAQFAPPGICGYLPWNWADDAVYAFAPGDPYLTTMKTYQT